MKIKKGFVLQKVGGSYLACATGKLAKEFSAMVKLNSTGAFLWNSIIDGNDISKEALIAKFAEAYSIDKDVAERDVEGFIGTLSSEGILE